MPLKDGVTYEDGTGRKLKVMGRTRDDESLVYTREGWWFRRSDGRFVFMGRVEAEPSIRDLIVTD